MSRLEDALGRIAAERPEALILPAAAALLQAGDAPGALGLTRDAISVGVPHAEIVQMLIQVAQRSGDDASLSMEALEVASGLGSPDAMSRLARLLGPSRAREAENLLRGAITLQPERIDHRMALARLQRDIGRPDEAITSLLRGLDGAPTTAAALTIAPFLRELEGLQATTEGRLRIALVGNATLDQLADCLYVETRRAGIPSEVRSGRFDQYAQELFDPGSWLYAFRPDVLVLAIHRGRLFPRLNDGVGLSEQELAEEIRSGIDQVRKLLLAFRRESGAVVVVHGIVAPQWPAAGVLDRHSTVGQTNAVAHVNEGLARLLRDEFASAYLIDEDAIQARSGKARATDPRTWYLARLPWAGEVLIDLARDHVRLLRAHKGWTRKCIVVDLDNTIWGGVLGEVGVAGIGVATDGTGSAYRGLQQELLSLWKRGFLLAACSKNDETEALAALDGHPAMLLRTSHLAAHRIGWGDKHEGIREIASELNIGLDGIVFLDDNPVERARVRAALPDVLVPELPRDPAGYRRALLELGAFDRVGNTAEDASRNEMYRAQRARKAAALAASDLDTYLRGLELAVSLEDAQPSAVPRISQLTLKTNQMTVTTRRYTETDIENLLASGACILTASVSDRFGADGLTGLAIVLPREDCWEIDSLVLSCRVMGRGIESALLAEVVDRASGAGVSRVRARYLRTDRNEPASPIYPNHGFAPVSGSADFQDWELALPAVVKVPDWLQVKRSAALTGAPTAEALP